MSWTGDRAFNRCKAKVVEYTDYGFPNPDVETEATSNGLIFPKGGYAEHPRDRVKGDNSTNSKYGGSVAKLHCPRTEDERVSAASDYSNHYGRNNALDSLRRNAGDLLCRTCIFSTMSEVDVAGYRANVARAEANRLEALAALEHARNELRAVSPHLLPPLAAEEQVVEPGQVDVPQELPPTEQAE